MWCELGWCDKVGFRVFPVNSLGMNSHYATSIEGPGGISKHATFVIDLGG